VTLSIHHHQQIPSDEVSKMVKLKTNHQRRNNYCINRICHAQQNLGSLLTSTNLKRWIIVLFLFYKLDYKDYYCYGSSSGISSSSAILNNENGKDFLDILSTFLIQVYLVASLPRRLKGGWPLKAIA